MFQVLVDFSKTGEKLTNKVFSPGSGTTKGLVVPKPTKVESEYDHDGTNIVSTEVYAAFSLARVESEYRTKKVKQPPPPSTNMMAAAMARGKSDDDDDDDDMET